MPRVLVLLSLVFVLANAYAVDPNANVASSCIKSWMFESKNMVWDKVDSTVLQKDLDSLKSIYTCVHDASKKLMSPDVKSTYDNNKIVVLDAVELNKYASVLKNKIKTLKDDTDKELKKLTDAAAVKQTSYFNIMRSPSNTKEEKILTDQSKKLEILSADADKVETNSATLASGVFGVYEKKRDASMPEICVGDDIVTPINTKLKDNTSLQESESLLSQMSKLKEDKTVDDEKLKTKFVGQYTEPAKRDEFFNSLMNDKYAISSTATTTTSSVAPTINNPSADQAIADKLQKDQAAAADKKKAEDAAAKLATDQAATTAAAVAQAAKEKEFKDLQEAVKLMQLKEAVPPAASNTNNSTGGASGTSGIGSTSVQAPQAYDPIKESERKKWLERAKQLDQQAMNQAMRQVLKAGRAVNRPSFSKSSGGGGSFSLKDLFSKPTEDSFSDDKKSTKDKNVPSFFGGDTTPKTQDADKYKKYYDMGTGPSDASSKDLTRSRFDSMYESARIKALTEGAYNTEFAGRYIDPFLLVHSIIDD
ncbi:MAG: hypothetical protein WCQ47_01590, partial [bacterium]